MNQVFNEALDKFCTVHLDDILVYSSMPSEHLTHLEWVFNKLKENSLYAKPSKCEFGLHKLEYLGHIITNGSVKPDPKKVEARTQWKSPSN